MTRLPALRLALLNATSSYDVPKLVRLRSKRLALLFHFASLAVLIYVGVYSLYVQKSYQAVSDFVAATEIRLQGYVSDDLHNRTYGPEDFSIIEKDAFFIPTALAWTPQQQGLCPGRRNQTWDAASANGGEACASDGDCEEGRRSAYGVQTGACDASGFCMLRTWCPLDAPRSGGGGRGGGGASSNVTTTVNLTGVGDMQVSLYIAVRWVKFLSSDGKTEQWESPAGRGDPGAMFYTVSGLLDMAGVSYDDVAAAGADVTLNFRFDCDWDLAQAKKACRPDLLSARIDPKGYSRTSALPSPALDASGSPFYAARTLQRTTGILFRLQFSGQARQFDFDSTVTTIGALLYFLSLVGSALDWLAPWLLPRHLRAAVDAATVEEVALHLLPPPPPTRQSELRRRGAAVAAMTDGEDGLDVAPTACA